MEAAGDRGAARALDTKALRADGNALIRADFGLGAQAPDVGPPGALWGGAQDRAIFLQSKVPCGLRGRAQFAMDLFCVVMMAQLFEQGVGLRQRGDLLCGEERREAFLPEVVRSLDLAFGLGSWREAQGDFVKVQGAAELGKGLWLTGEEEGMVIDIESQRQTVLDEAGRQEVKMGRQVFTFIDASPGDQAAMVIKESQKRRLALLAREPAMGRRVVLPELADRLNLPAAHWARRIFTRADGSQTLAQSPSANRGAMQGEVMPAEHFGGRKAIRAGRDGTQKLTQRGDDGIGKGLALVAS